ncbi:MAG: penicillin acylase family protein [Gemmataceae bacterium]|nr:penicillin acylase family protein [Gemmataceae bacterium]
MLFWRAAVAQLPVVGEAERAILAAYTRGVNAGTSAGLRKPPHEFAILGGTPSAWEPADVLAGLKLQTFLLPSNWDVELARLRVLLADGHDAVRALDPGTDEGVKGRRGEGVTEPTPSPLHPFTPSHVLDRLLEDLGALSQFARQGGSNNWAISGGRTATGQPLLASDPHLAPNAPPPWYLAHLRTPDWELLGATLAGAPGFPIGHNGHAAWGVTAGLADNTDFFVETLGPGGASVRQPDGSFAPCEVVREVIRAKKAAGVTEEVLVTPRGPVLTPPLTGVPVALSLRAVWLDPLPLSGFLTAYRATSFDEFRRCFAAWPGMPLNVMYADAAGTIGRQLVGQLPARKGGNGLLPRPADAPDSGWEPELVPFERMPFEANPEAGFLATANDDPAASREGNRPVQAHPVAHAPGSDEPFLGADFLDPYRANTIRDELAKRSAWDVAGCAALQLSTRSLPWEEMRDSVLSLAPADADAREALDLLRAWDGDVSADSPAAAVFELFVAELCVRVAKAKAPTGWLAAVGETALGTDGHNLFCDRRVGHLIRLLREQPAGWFPRPWPAELLDALGGVVRRLRRDAGPGPGFWVWGNVRQLKLTHPLFGRSKLLGPAFNLGPIPVGGDANTVSQAGCRPADPTGFTHNMANLRAVFDLADVSRSVFVLCGGQSGNPLSPHFADQFPLWQDGETVNPPWAPERVQREARETLRLWPAKPN